MKKLLSANGYNHTNVNDLSSELSAGKTLDLVNKADRVFMAHLSHEIKTPLNAILGFTQILKESITDPTLTHYLNVIGSSGDTLLSIVNNNFDISAADLHPIQFDANYQTEKNRIDPCELPKENRASDTADAESVQIDCVPDDQRVAEDGFLNGAQQDSAILFLKRPAMPIEKIIFAVDDCENNLDIIAHLYAEEDVKVVLFTSGQDVLDAIHNVKPSIILLDVVMPKMDGFEVCRRLKADTTTKGIPIIFLTGQTDPDNIVRGFQSGGVDYIGKPFKKEELLSRVNTHLRLHETEQSLMTALIDKEQLLNETLKGSIKVLIDILAVTNPDAFTQTLRVRSMAKKMSQRLGMENIWEIEIGILLSHLGCAVIPSEIVKKKHHGGRLTTQEKIVFNSHPKAAARFISKIPRLERVAESIQNQFTDYNPRLESDIIRDFIRVVFDYDNYLQLGHTQQQALDEMNMKAASYNPRVMGALEAEVRKLMEGYVVRFVSFDELKSGMILADDIHNGNGVTLVRRNSELSDVVLEKLKNLGYYGRLSNSVKILEQIM